MTFHRRCLLVAMLTGGCSAVPTRPIECNSFDRCEPLQFVLGQPDDVTNNRLRSGLSSPTSALVSMNRLIVADTGHHRVLIWSTFPPAKNQPPDVVLGQPDLTTSQQNYGGLSARSLSAPASLASDGTRLVVGDSGNHRLLVWQMFPTANFAPADVVLGQRDFLTAQPPTSTTNQTVGGYPIAGPSLYAGVSLVPSPKNAAQSMLIATDAGAHRLVFWDPIPTMSFAAETGELGQSDFVSATSGTSTAKFQNPSGSVSFESTQLAIADSQNNRIAVFSAPNTDGAQTITGTTFLGQTDGASGNANQGMAAPTRSSLSLPRGLSAVGKTLYVADSRNNRVMIWNDLTIATGSNADFVLGQSNFTTAAPGAVAGISLLNPHSVWSNTMNTVVADTGNNRVMLWQKAITALGQTADAVVGQPSFTQNQIATSPTLSDTELSSPFSMCADGVFLVADTYANRVLVYPRTPLLHDDAPSFVLGQMDFTSSQPLAGGPSASSLNQPAGVSCQNGVIAVADTYNHRVLLWTRPISGNAQPADLVVGQASATTNDINHGGAQVGLSYPSSVLLWNGALHVADNGNHRVLI